MITISHNHNLNKEIAHERIETLLSNLQKEHAESIKSASGAWNQDKSKFSFSVSINVVFPVKFSGTIKNEPGIVSLSGDLPFLALPMKDKIIEIIKSQMKKTFI